MKKTPLAKAYELIEEGCFGDLLKRKTELLEEERQNLTDAVTYGNRQDFYDGTETLGDQYFNKTYDQ
jgi:hypothetical protein